MTTAVSPVGTNGKLTSAPRHRQRPPISLFAAILFATLPAAAQTAAGSSTATPLITQAVTAQITSLTGHVSQRLLADAQDQGPVPDSLRLRLYFVLQKSPAQQSDLANLIARQQQPTAAEYHKWLTPHQYGQRFGAAQQDVAAITSWLKSQGLQVNGLLNNASVIDVAATAGQIRQVLGTPLHYLSLHGSVFPAAIQDPTVPAALAPAIAGINGLTKIPPRIQVVNPHLASFNASNHTWQLNSTANTVAPSYSAGPTSYLVSPRDLYAIYNLNPVQSPTGLNDLGAASSVAVIEQSDIEYGTVYASGIATGGDVATFRSLFGVPGTLNMHVYHGYGSVACNAPGIDPNGVQEDIEAALDAEWANATAPSANLIFMACDQSVDNGITSSLLAVIDNNLADVVSVSYVSSEFYFTSASNYSIFDAMWAQAAAQGQSVLISSGDSGSDVKDQGTSAAATAGINVSALSASPNVTSTGGTDFADYFDAHEGGQPESTYWGANSAFYNNALGYIPETTWNNSCASSILGRLEGYSGAALCASGNFTGGAYFAAGSGGFSTHYPVPSYQTGVFGYSGTFRAQPDISGFAANGIYGHSLIYCNSNRASTCASNATFGTAGGTSFVAPYMAGIVASLVTYTGSRQGVLNPALYALAKTQFSASATSSACYSNGQTGNAGVTTALPASKCIFNDITTGNIDQACAAGSASCYVNPGASYGMLSLTGSASLSVAYPSTPGYDLATGLGSVNVYNWFTNWKNAFSATVTLVANPTSITTGQSTTLTATVSAGIPTGYVDTPPPLTGIVSFSGNAGVINTCTLAAGTCNITVASSALQSGSNALTATFQGDPTYPSATSSIRTVTLNLLSQTITFAAIATQSVANPLTLTASASSGLPVSYSASPIAVCSVSGSLVSFASAGTCSVTASQAGNVTYAAATSVTQSFTVTAPLQSQTITFASIATQSLGINLTLIATASSGLTVSYSATPGTVCTVTGSTASFTGLGSCTLTASQAGNSTYSAAAPVTQTFSVVTNASSTPTAFITAETPGAPRNNSSGFVGFQFTVGAIPIQVSSLGRFVISGNTAIHTVKLVQANGTDVTGGSALVSTSAATPGQFAYVALASPVTLLANTTYFLASQEISGGDYWNDYGAVTASSVASVLAPSYTDAAGHYVAISGMPGKAYVPVNFLYAPSLAAAITSPAAGSIVSGNASVVVSTMGSVTGLQLLVDGNYQGSLLPVSVNQGPTYTVSLDTTVLTNATHSFAVLVYGSSTPVTSSTVSITVANSPASFAPFVIGQRPATVRSNYTGLVGMALTTGATPVTVTALGRYVLSGNTATHLIKLVSANGTDVSGGSVMLPAAQATPGQFAYASLSGPVTLQPNTSYFLVSQETAGGDTWYDIAPVSTSSIATVTAPAYGTTSGTYLSVSGAVGQSYVPLSFLYSSTGTALSAAITSPANGALLSGDGIPVTVTTTGTVSSLQLVVDGINQGSAVKSSPLALNTSTLSNGQHTLLVVVSGGGATAGSSAITIAVHNGVAASATAFVTSQTLATLRNNYSGNVGFAIKVGTTPLTVTALGRLAAAGNTGTHTLQLVQSNGAPLSGGSVSVSLSGATAGQYVYATLPSPLALLANTTYYLVSQETAGGDFWYNLEPVTNTSAGQITGPTYADAHGSNVIVSGFPGYSYVPLNFKYQ